MQNMRERDMIEVLLAPQKCMGANAHGVNESPWSKALRVSNIMSAFQDTGLWPVNYDRVKGMAHGKGLPAGDAAPTQQAA